MSAPIYKFRNNLRSGGERRGGHVPRLVEKQKLASNLNKEIVKGGGPHILVIIAGIY